MAARVQLRVIRAVLDAIETLIGEFVPLFRIYIGPWAAGIATGLLVYLLWGEEIRTGMAPELVAALAFAPFAALVAVGVIRWLIGPRDAFSTFHFDGTWGWVTALYALLALFDTAQLHAVQHWAGMLHDNGVPFPDATDVLGSRAISFALYFLPAWLLTAIVYALVLPQAAVVVEKAAPSPERQWQLMRLAPIAILLTAVLIGLCRLGISNLYWTAITAVGIGSGPLDGLLDGLPKQVAATIWQSLWLLPSHFLTDMLALVALARTYKALATYADGRSGARGQLPAG